MTTMANPIDATQAYFEAWNRRDTAGIVAAFAPGGTYSDPSAGEQLAGDAIAAYAGGLFTAFPDLHFDLGASLVDGGGMVVTEWMMRGTHTGPLAGGPPTGCTIALPGIDVIAVQDGQVASVRGFFDRQTLLEQLGLQVIAQPYRTGPVTFGTGVRLESRDPSLPGAMSLTMLEVGSEADALRVREDARRIMPELARMRGFLGMTAIMTGRRLYTITAWAEPEDIHQLRAGLHLESVRKVCGAELGVAGLTGVWTPQRLIRRGRCTACGKWAMLEGDRPRCECGQELPAPAPVW